MNTKPLLALSLFGSIVGVGCNHGGCPWTSLSQPVIAPAIACLTVTAAESGTGGCVDPGLIVHNGCTETLTLPASDSTGHVALVAAPGAEVAFDVPIALGVDAHPGLAFAVPATLGNQDLVISFHTSD